MKPPAGFTKRKHDRYAFYAYIFCVVLAFAREAFELGKQGIWTIPRIRLEVDEFLRQFTIEAHSEKGHDRLTSSWEYDSLLSAVKRIFYTHSEQGRQFKAELRAVAEFQAVQERELKATAAKRRESIEPQAQADSQATAPPPAPDNNATLIEQRKTILTEWEKNPRHKRTHLHNGRIENPGKPGSPLITKKQFYAWLAGVLPLVARAGRRLEAYLRQNTPRPSRDQSKSP